MSLQRQCNLHRIAVVMCRSTLDVDSVNRSAYPFFSKEEDMFDEKIKHVFLLVYFKFSRHLLLLDICH